MAPKFLIDPDDTMRDLADDMDAVDEAMLYLVEAGTVTASCDACNQSVTPEEFDACTCPRCGERPLESFLFTLPS